MRLRVSGYSLNRRYVRWIATTALNAECLGYLDVASMYIMVDACTKNFHAIPKAAHNTVSGGLDAFQLCEHTLRNVFHVCAYIVPTINMVRPIYSKLKIKGFIFVLATNRDLLNFHVSIQMYVDWSFQIIYAVCENLTTMRFDDTDIRQWYLAHFIHENWVLLSLWL